MQQQQQHHHQQSSTHQQLQESPSNLGNLTVQQSIAQTSTGNGTAVPSGMYSTAMLTLTAAPNQNLNVIAAPIVVDISNFTVNCITQPTPYDNNNM